MVIGVGQPQGIPRGSIPGSNKSADPQTQPTAKVEFSKKGINRIDVDLATARIAEPLEISGTMLWAIRATESGATTNDAVLEVAYDKTSNDDVPFLPGVKLSGVPFNKIFLTNDAQANKIMTLVYANDFPDDRIGTDS